MASGPIIAPSAHRHGIDDGEIRHAFAHPIWAFDMDDGFTMLIGVVRSGALRDRRGRVGRRARCFDAMAAGEKFMR